ncbi:isoprenylcysteine carboxylmethyltransferase family protein [Mycobacterium sp. 852014-52144_SCH5372336]|uniref:methyltransferase family protein n=1 Tax=Mycobacterium sp. 852014-52144_SCH5372336 TaxID=1834115 RepID=UPI000A95713B
MLAIIIGLAAPLLQLLDVLSPLAALHTPPIQTLATTLAVVDIAATPYAQNDMGESWRISVTPSETRTLVRRGVFAIVRNPIFTAILTFAAGVALMTPSPLAITGFALLLATIELQVRVVEEPHLRPRPQLPQLRQNRRPLRAESRNDPPITPSPWATPARGIPTTASMRTGREIHTYRHRDSGSSTG